MKATLDILRKLLRDPAAAAGLVIVLLLVAVAVVAPLIATHPEAVWDMNPRQRLLPPSEAYLFGTDRMGADIYSRILQPHPVRRSHHTHDRHHGGRGRAPDRCSDRPRLGMAAELARRSADAHLRHIPRGSPDRPGHRHIADARPFY
jgi:hypothetical protein